MIHILIVEDEKPISDLLKLSLNRAGYSCQCVYDGNAAADLLELSEHKFDLILLDVMLPGVDGFELMEYISPLQIPVIFITAKNSVSDRVRGLKMGADDYLVKPFEIIELLARVEAVLRRNHKIDNVIELADIQIDLRSRLVKKQEEEIPLTKKEFDILVLFMQNPGVALYRETIYERVWGGDFSGNSRTVDLHVQRLRKKTGWEERIKAVHKVGYRLEV
ncbi:Transcriptional regulatory protein walR [uncultured Roseburia sp.]|uniref:Stage 0 sporulation protein A homolog n=1 Tax=Brotonthovivens ammoniilytica TaxID=2981725 RepID=A0ABT2TKU6_9FIRM|nr:response regulator transcription factor [Brotonthovivens ammoniilytica]MCU6762834.1 response regulator transcription factor [Brotonthovivens ammoniilytica]SCI90602.1 Transcriptional regulatory protein walR [uncultured Roseburia sp.]